MCNRVFILPRWLALIAGPFSNYIYTNALYCYDNYCNFLIFSSYLFTDSELDCMHAYRQTGRQTVWDYYVVHYSSALRQIDDDHGKTRKNIQSYKHNNNKKNNNNNIR